MKKIININLSGRLIPMEDTAYEQLKNYLDSLTHYFGREEGGEEIVSDIENRIAELFQEKLKKGTHCITDQDVDIMIATMGRPEQLEEETSTEPLEKETAGGQYQQQNAGASHRLTRNENDKLIGGVCSGIANYFKTDPAIVRVITFILILIYGVGLMAYIILWIALPGSKGNSQTLRKRLYRDTDHKVIGGVASGMAAYFKVDTVIPRIIFILPLLGVIFTSIFSNAFDVWGFHSIFFPFSVGALPTLIVLYIVLWIAVPKAVTQAEKLEMRGEKVDLQSLSNAYKSTGDEKKKIDPNPNSETSTSSTLPDSPKKHGAIGEIFGTLVKVVLYFIIGIIIITICGLLIGLAGGFLGVTTVASFAFPLKSLILATPLQHVLIWPAVILTLGIPIVALIWILVKLVTGFRPRFRYVGLSLFSLWIMGVICAICLLVSVGKDFRMHYSRTEDIVIAQPKQTLILEQPVSNERISSWNGAISGWDEEYGANGWFDNFVRISEDSFMLEAVKLAVRKSKDSNYHVRVVRFSNGRTAEQARRYASMINYQVQQKDSILYIPESFVLPKGVPFRNQHLLLEIFIPEGKKIDFRDDLEELKEDYFDRDDWDWDNHDDWDENETHKVFHMTTEGGLIPDIKIEVKENY